MQSRHEWKIGGSGSETVGVKHMPKSVLLVAVLVGLSTAPMRARSPRRKSNIARMTIGNIAGMTD